MGCDIHPHIEIEHPVDPEKDYHYTGYFGKLNLERDYYMFSLMADVRNDGTVPVIIPPRGIPDDMSTYVRSEYCMFVVDSPTDEPGYCTVEDAQKYVDSHGSRIFESYLGPVTRSIVAKHDYVENPDWHSASYLYANEFGEIMQKFYRDAKSQGHPDLKLPDYNAALAAMIALDAAAKRGGRARLVFWFDN